MVQGENESVNTFIAKLKAQAALCDFTVNSSCSKANCAHQQSVSFSEAMICHQMVSGLNDQDNQAQLLSEAEKLDTLEKRLLAMEASQPMHTTIRSRYVKSVQDCSPKVRLQTAR